MAEESAENRRPGSSVYGYLSKTPSQPEPRRGYVNREQRNLRLVLTAFNIAKVVALVLLFLLILGMI